MNDNQLFSSFMMLNKHLYDVFVQYIVNGRTRAPKETELIEMLPTFQYGAKRDRRAMQSKFKSWAKRMNFENGCLVLANIGKIIIPKEVCDDLIMSMHFEEHTDIENVINKIRRTYTWTKKNFGMDRDIVVESIMRNCKKEECIKKMRLEIAKLGNSFCSGMLNISAPGMIPFGIPPSLPYFPPYHYPLPFPVSPAFSPGGFPFPVQFLENMHGTGSLRTAIDESKGLMTENCISVPHSLADITNSTEKLMPVKFQKPKNIQAYKDLLEAVRKYPRKFPQILGSEKIQFLSTLGLVPKIMCSSRILRNFRKQLKQKRFMTRDCIIYRNRKMLRDKNKLKRCSDQKKQRNYLGLTFLKKSSLSRSETENSVSKQSQSFKIAKKPISEKENVSSSMKRVKLSDNEKNKPIELITIDSSDEESSEKDSFWPTKEETQEGGVKTEEKSSSMQTDFNDLHLETTTEEPQNIDIDFENSNKNKGPNKQKEIKPNCSEKVDDDPNNLEKEVKNKNFGIETSQHKPTISQKLRNAILKENIRRLKSGNYVDCLSSKLSDESDNLSKELSLSVPQFTVLQSTKAIPMAANSIAYLPPYLNSMPVIVRSVSPSPLQPSTSFAASGQINNVKIVYPAKLTKATPSKVVIMDKQQKGAYFVIPSYNKPLLSQNDIRIHPQGAFKSNTSSMVLSMFASQLHQLKPKPKENETIRSYGNSSKTDIDEEMSKIAAWIYRMKSILNPCTLNNEEEKSVQKLMSQLDVGIHLVRKAKKCLKEIEHVMDKSESSMEVAE